MHALLITLCLDVIKGCKTYARRTAGCSDCALVHITGRTLTHACSSFGSSCTAQLFASQAGHAGYSFCCNIVVEAPHLSHLSSKLSAFSSSSCALRVSRMSAILPGTALSMSPHEIPSGASEAGSSYSRIGIPMWGSLACCTHSGCMAAHDSEQRLQDFMQPCAQRSQPRLRGYIRTSG